MRGYHPVISQGLRSGIESWTLKVFSDGMPRVGHIMLTTQWTFMCIYIYFFFTMQATKSPYDVRIRRYSHYIVSFFPHLFVWNIYLHLGNFGSKCWKLFHTWSIGASGLVPNIGWRDPVGLLHWMEYSRRSTKRPGLRGNGHPWRFTVYRWCSSLFSHMGNCHLHIISIGIWYGHMAIIIGVCFIPIYF